MINSALWTLVSRNRDIRSLLGASLISLTGDWALQVGLAYLVFALTGSTLASGGVLLASVLPQVLLGSVAGVFVDRWDRRRTMITANLLLAAGLIPLFAVDGVHRVWIIYLVTAAESSIEQFFTPAEAALVPHLVDADQLMTANALNSQNRDAARLIGSALGGVAAATSGVGLLAAIDIASYLIAAALLSRIRPAKRLPRAGLDAETALPMTTVQQWRDGLRLVATNRSLRVLLCVEAVSSIGQGIMSTLFAPFVRDVLHGSASSYGGIVSVQAIGGIIGGLLAASIAHRFQPRSLLGWGALAFGLIDLALFCYPLLSPTLWPAFVLMIVVGFPGAIAVAGLMTIFQESTRDSHRGRIFGAVLAVQAITMLVGIALGSVLGSLIGIVPVIAFQGVGWVASGVIVLLWLPRRASIPVRLNA